VYLQLKVFCVAYGPFSGGGQSECGITASEEECGGRCRNSLGVSWSWIVIAGNGECEMILIFLCLSIFT